MATWERLAHVTASGAVAEVTTGTFSAYENLKVETYYTGTGTGDAFINFNGDESGNYANRYSRNGGTDATDSSQSIGLRLEQGTTTPQYSVINIKNVSDEEKMVIGYTMTQGSSGAGNAPTRQDWHGKWANTSANITEITLDRASDNFAVGSYITVWGANPAPVTADVITVDCGTDATPTVTDDLTTDDGWVSTSSDWAYNASDYLYLDPIRRSTTSQQIYIDLQDADYLGSGNNLHATKWVTRFKFETETLTSATGNAEVFIGLSDTSGASSQATNQDMVYLSINGNSNEPIFYFYGVAGTGMLTSRTGAGFSPSISNSTTTFYCEIVRNSDVYTARVTTSDDYTGGSTATITKSGLTDLRWLKLSNDNEQNGQTWKGKLHEVKIYNGITAVTSGKKHLMVQVKGIGTGGTINCNLTFNSDTGSNYSIRESVNGGADSTNVSQANTDNITGTVTGNVFATVHILNEASKEKLFISDGLESASGAGNSPERKEMVGKWANTSAQITTIKANNGGTGSFADGSEVTVYGTDQTT